MKRAFDLFLGAVGLVLLSPLLALLAVVVWCSVGRPVLFRQMRPGLDGDLFWLIKFRTMTDERDAEGTLLPEAERLTRVGRFLRSTSLDELPELWNVVKGDMSLVGPRPLLPDYLPLYSERQARRHDVRPGITGWAQINGRNAVGWTERLEMDVWYVENRSVVIDLRILVMTVWKVLMRDGIRNEAATTMPRFQGSHKAENRAPTTSNGGSNA